MVYVIAAPCVADYSCLEVCPVNCISPRPDDIQFDQTEQLYIDSTVCVNCGACVPACPVTAIYEASALPEKWKHYEQVNAQYFSRELL
jgi:formate hydrogenlyase subunit 6/NADH:ubiquinone oxidoreductase subunit I